MAEIAHAAARLMLAGRKSREEVLEAVLCLHSAANQCGTQSRAEGISAGVGKPILKSPKGLIAVSERIKCWSLKLNGPRWTRAVGHMGNVG
ncbi:MAG: hypothetical protein ABSH14_07610 [Verrucomicrobiia bacterium]|jgi:hypothetical protein